MIDPQYYGPWAVIAGGSEGVGAGFADELSKIGINLVLIARKPGPLEETAATTEELAASVKATAQASRQAASVATEAMQAAQNGGGS